MANKNQQHHSSGVALVELSIALVIVGLLTAGFFAFLNTRLEQKKREEMEEKMTLMRSTLAEYIKDLPDKPDVVDGSGNVIESFAHTRWNTANAFEDDAIHYPCPAPLTAKIGDANFGVESRDNATGRCDASVAGVFQVTGASGQRVFIGTFPTATLGIGSDNMEDPYRSKYLYAVSDMPSRTMALDGANPAGAITVNDRSDISSPEIITAEFVILSHGEDRKGSYLFESDVRFSNCTGSEADQENCDLNDATFSVELRSEGNNNDYFDDTLAFTFVEADQSGNSFLPDCAPGESIMMGADGEAVCGPKLVCTESPRDRLIYNSCSGIHSCYQRPTVVCTTDDSSCGMYFAPIWDNYFITTAVNEGCIKNAPVGQACRGPSVGGYAGMCDASYAAALECNVEGEWEMTVTCMNQGK